MDADNSSKYMRWQSPWHKSADDTDRISMDVLRYLRTGFAIFLKTIINVVNEFK